jgi:hypothetical protein
LSDADDVIEPVAVTKSEIMQPQNKIKMIFALCFVSRVAPGTPAS